MNQLPFFVKPLRILVNPWQAVHSFDNAAGWMETITHVVCPDPACGLIKGLDRIGEGR
jgi:hypothetical protein